MLIKICGMTRQEDLDSAAQAGVHYCGFIFHPESPRYLSPDKAKLLNSYNMLRVGVFVTDDLHYIRKTMAAANLDYIQLHGAQSSECAVNIGPEKVIRVLWPEKYSSISHLEEDAKKLASSCAMYLLDSGLRGGGSGINLSWKDLRHIKLYRPWILAGGLNVHNISCAIRDCTPDGIDFNSGVETGPGIKNAQKIKESMDALKAAMSQ